MSTLGGVQYTGEIMSTAGDTIMSVGGYHEYTGGYHNKCGDIMSTLKIVQYTGVCIQIQLFSQ